MLQKIDCIMLRVDDLDRGAAFYEQVFGLTPHWRDETSIGMNMPGTDAEIVLHTMDLDYSVHFLVDDVPEAVDAYVQAGCLVRVLPFDVVIGKCAVVEDPFGNALPILDMSKGSRT